MKFNLNNKKSSNKTYNERGFTLIELLAVIVVLAVVMLIGVNAVLPQMEKARKNAFAIEADGIIKSAQQYVVNKQLEKSIVIGDNACGCVTVKVLRDDGQTELNTDYVGYVIVTNLRNSLRYEVSLNNGSYNVDKAGLNDSHENTGVSGENDVKETTATTAVGDDCANKKNFNNTTCTDISK